MIKVFFDASVIFSALYSNQGGSNKLAQLVRQKKIVGITSQTVIEELQENLGKIDKLDFRKFHQFILDFGFIVRERIAQPEIKPFLGLVDSRDAHVVAGAVLTGCDYLVTLDKKHLDNPTIKTKISQVKIVSPKELLATI
jgi:putative PIN family toxin of toxin-antitoxin system